MISKVGLKSLSECRASSVLPPNSLHPLNGRSSIVFCISLGIPEAWSKDLLITMAVAIEFESNVCCIESYLQWWPGIKQTLGHKWQTHALTPGANLCVNLLRESQIKSFFDKTAWLFVISWSLVFFLPHKLSLLYSLSFELNFNCSCLNLFICTHYYQWAQHRVNKLLLEVLRSYSITLAHFCSGINIARLCRNNFARSQEVFIARQTTWPGTAACKMSDNLRGFSWTTSTGSSNAQATLLVSSWNHL